MTNPYLVEATAAVIKVGDGRGFIIDHVDQRLVVTAAHCLPQFPPAHAASYLHERTYGKLLGALDIAEPTIWAECLFADPIADLAVLGAPDNQELWEENEAYEAFIEPRSALPIGAAPDTTPAWMLRLDGRWMRCTVSHRGGALWLESSEETVKGGMSGSPIVDDNGVAIGAISTGSASNPRLMRDLPAWLVTDEDAQRKAETLKQLVGRTPAITLYDAPSARPPGTVEV